MASDYPFGILDLRLLITIGDVYLLNLYHIGYRNFRFTASDYPFDLRLLDPFGFFQLFLHIFFFIGNEVVYLLFFFLLYSFLGILRARKFLYPMWYKLRRYTSPIVTPHSPLDRNQHNMDIFYYRNRSFTPAWFFFILGFPEPN